MPLSSEGGFGGLELALAVTRSAPVESGSIVNCWLDLGIIRRG